jgi:hypothetical protein
VALAEPIFSEAVKIVSSLRAAATTATLPGFRAAWCSSAPAGAQESVVMRPGLDSMAP